MPEAYLFQLVVCWWFFLTGRCEPIIISKPLTLEYCERAEIRVRARRGKNIMAYCL